MSDQRSNSAAAANRRQAAAHSQSVSLGDLYFVVFRHKWKILIISTLALISAAVVKVTSQLTYQSEAKLYIRYVMENKPSGTPGVADQRATSVDPRGAVISTEIELLGSLDLAESVAKAITPEKVLSKINGHTNLNEAAAVIHRGISIDPPRVNSSVIRLTVTHPDVTVVQPVLKQLVEDYLKKHKDIHTPTSGSDDLLTRETDTYKARLAETEDALRKAKRRAGVFSLDDSKKAYTEEISKTRQQIFETDAALAEARARVSEMLKDPRNEGLRPNALPGTNSATAAVASAGTQGATNLVSVTNLVAGVTNPAPSLTNVTNVSVVAATNALTVATNIAAVEATEAPPAKVDAYRRAVAHLVDLGKREDQYLLSFTGEYPPLKVLREQIAEVQKTKEQLEKEYPSLVPRRNVQAKAADPSSPVQVAVAERDDGAIADRRARQLALATESARVVSLQSKLDTLKNQLESIRKEFSSLDENEGAIAELMRKRDLEEQNYKKFLTSKEQQRIDEAMGPDRISNITLLEAPTPPAPLDSKVNKMVMGVAIGGLAFAFGLAFFIEFFVDRTVKRSSEVETNLGLSLFLSIPQLASLRRRKAVKSAAAVPLLANGEPDPVAKTSLEVSASRANPEMQPWNPLHPLRLHFEVLRDRLLHHFEVRKVTHKPKLVAVTSCADGAGVTTIAAGLAASLSETGDGNVLLVDMKHDGGAAHYFYRGNLGCGLDDALEMNKRDMAMVQENLYLVTENTKATEHSPRVLPRRFHDLVPKLEASDYDYIIFDMPPVSQTSVTPRLARFMDMVLLVVESEKTDRDIVKRASGLLAETASNISVVLNKGKRYVPQRLQQEL